MQQLRQKARNNTIDSANRAMGDSFNGEVMMESMLPTWKTGMAQMVDTITAPGTGFKDATTAAMNSVTDASKALATAIKELNELLGLKDGGLADVNKFILCNCRTGCKRLCNRSTSEY